MNGGGMMWGMGLPNLIGIIVLLLAIAQHDRERKMVMRPLFFIALALALSPIATPALAQEFKGGTITIDRSWARATPNGAEVGVVHNNGETPDRLTGGSADFASVEIHEMKTENGVMTMPGTEERPRYSRTCNRSVHAGRLSRHVRPFGEAARQRGKD
jgi:copper chaperone PCu(A)C